MKKLTLLSLVGITSIALAHAGWAAGHGGGGGGYGGSGFHGGGGFRGGGFRGGGFGGHFSSMRGGHTFARGGTGTWGGRNWGGNWRHHRFSNDVFIGDFGFPGWWGWGYPYGYYGYDYYPYDSYGYGGYPYDSYGYG